MTGVPRERACHVRLEGRVQGVGFRWHARLEARALGLSGWVRNCDDGSVEAVVEGAGAAVDELLLWFAEGPSGSRVDSVTVEAVQPSGHVGFIIRE